MRRIRSAAFAALLAASSAHAQQQLPLYAGAIPNSRVAPDEEAIRDPREPAPFLLNVSQPTLTVYLPGRADPNRAAVIISPGGSYRGVSIEKEGHAVARAFNSLGVAAFVLKYRTPSERHMQDRARGALQDAQQAVRLVREQAREWRIDPSRVGFVGFSAGGHLAATVATQFDRPVAPGTPGANLRPDFLVLIYPVISMQDDIAHKTSREMLLGTSPTQAMVDAWSSELHVATTTPPTMLVHAADDASVPVAHSLRFFEALRARSIPAELIVYPAGGHGFGLNNATTRDRWLERCRDWLMSQGWLAQAAP